MDEVKFSQGIDFLAKQGLNLFATLDCKALPDDVTEAMLAEDISLPDYASLVLIGHGGRRLWQALSAFGMKTTNPVDHFSLLMTQRFIDEFLDSPPVLMLYPGGPNMPLQQLGSLAGWQHPSPLGLGINETYGLWFAYRTAFLTRLSLPVKLNPITSSPCDACQDKPCVSVCPVQAVQGTGQFKLTRCISFRLQAQAICQDRCLSRLACPVAPQHRYEPEQLSYHYTYSLESIRRYYHQE